MIIEYSDEKNPSDLQGNTPFHKAAELGNLKVCQLMLENVHGELPQDDNDFTPLDIAAENWNLDICKLIMENFKDSPIGVWDTNPLFLESPYANLP